MRGIGAGTTTTGTVTTIGAITTFGVAGALVVAGLVTAAPALGPCADSGHRQFDFWLGDWDVVGSRRPDAPPAHNRIESLYDGCLVRETYENPSGYAGTSLNGYDQRTGRWHQTWIDNTGLVLRISGGLDEDGWMVLASEPPPEGERGTMDRITWTPLPDGRVRQVWEQSEDRGETWKTVFDGMYTRRDGSGDGGG